MSFNAYPYIVRRLKENKKFLYVASFLYNLWYSPATMFCRKKGVKLSGAFLRRVRIKVIGNNNQVTISPKVMMSHCIITITGDNCKIFVEGGGTNIQHCNIEVKHSGSQVIIQKGFTTEQVALKACEGRKIEIGEDCMFSAGIYISTTDFHSVVDLNTGERLNPAQDVIIGNHVWLASGVSVLKGSFITEHVVIGKGSVVTGNIDQSHSVYVGVPAKKVKEGITWKREI